MTLPLIKAPIYELTLPIKTEKVKYRPFNVKEQKILMIALESDDPIFVNDNIKEVIKLCCNSDIDVDSLSITDIEYFFLQLRARSIGEIISPRYVCKNTVEDDYCNNSMETEINILDVEVDLNGYSDIINLDSSIGLKMKHPNFDIIKNFSDDDLVVDMTTEIISECVDYVFDSDKLYYRDEFTKQELVEWIDNLNNEQFERIEKHFKHLPKLRKEINLTCSKCGYEHKIIVEGLESFLA
jgi:T4 bacteriophage base plate protein